MPERNYSRAGGPHWQMQDLLQRSDGRIVHPIGFWIGLKSAGADSGIGLGNRRQAAPFFAAQEVYCS